MRLYLKQTLKICLISIILSLIGLLIWKEFSISFKIDSINNQHGGHLLKDKQPVELAHGPALGSNQNIHLRSQRSAKWLEIAGEKLDSTDRRPAKRLTDVSDIFISVKTTVRNHKVRLQLLLDTWIRAVKNQTYIFTDEDDEDIIHQLPSHHFINTHCPKTHDRKALVCKMGVEFDAFIASKKRWFCHVDDDTFVNVDTLLQLIQRYNHTGDWYLGKPSLHHPIEVMDRSNPGQRIAFWFATGGAGFCISRGLALKMIPYAGGGRLKRAGEQIRLPDDCTIGYVIETLLHKELTVIPEFHSHLEVLWQIRQPHVKSQITFGYNLDKERSNVVNIAGFSEEKDPTRFWSIHCHLHPFTKECLENS